MARDRSDLGRQSQSVREDVSANSQKVTVILSLTLLTPGAAQAEFTAS